MNHMDRQRLSHILDDMLREIDHIADMAADPRIAGTEYMLKAKTLDAPLEALDIHLRNARALVDGTTPLPAPTAPPNNTTPVTPAEHELWAKFVNHNDSEFGRWYTTPPEPFTDHPRWTRRRKITIITALAGAILILITLTASAAPNPGPSHRPTPQTPGEVPSRAAPDWFRGAVPTP